MKLAVTLAFLGATYAYSVSAQTVPGADWSGFYAGLSAGMTDDSDDLLGGGVFVSEQNFEGSGAGLFLGYNVQNGALVYGGELAFAPFEVNGTNNTGLREDYIDLKGRLG
ncbi:MAG: hypothetical protein C0524_17310 [Rhodobacter sp.]|nr:hypothetical protein [Rhodobacter sp.]